MVGSGLARMSEGILSVSERIRHDGNEELAAVGDSERLHMLSYNTLNGYDFTRIIDPATRLTVLLLLKRGSGVCRGSRPWFLHRDDAGEPYSSDCAASAGRLRST